MFMNKDELSAWALSLRKLLEHGLVNDTIEVLNSVIIDNKSENDDKNQE